MGFLEAQGLGTELYLIGAESFALSRFHFHRTRRFIRRLRVFDHVRYASNSQSLTHKPYAALGSHTGLRIRTRLINSLVRQVTASRCAIIKPQLLDVNQRKLAGAIGEMLESRYSYKALLLTHGVMSIVSIPSGQDDGIDTL